MTAAETRQVATNRWLAQLVRTFEEAPGTFLEALPRRSGALTGKTGHCDWRASNVSRDALRCSLEIARLEGLVRLDLVRVPAHNPTAGGSNDLGVAGRLSVGTGTARLYLEIDRDLGRLAAALGGGQPPVPPVVRRGFRYAEAKPAAAAAVQGQAAVLGSHLTVWVEAVGGPAAALHLELTLL